MKRFLQLFAIDTRTLALLRVSLGVLTIVDVSLRARDLTAHYTDRGVLPGAVAISGNIPHLGPSFHFLSGDFEVQALLFALHVLAGFCLLVGYRTRVATILVWMFTVSLAARNPFILNGGDRVLRLILFWAMFLPWGERCSVDRLLDRSSGEQRGSIVSFAAAALLLQGFFVYFVTGYLKTGGDPWWDGTAIYYALSLDQFALPLGERLLDYPDLLTALTYSVLLLEILGPLLLFSPKWTDGCRILVIGALVVFQTGLAATMSLGLFPWTSTVLILAYLPGSCWNWVAKLGRERLPPATLGLFEEISAGWRRVVFRYLPHGAPARVRIHPTIASFAEKYVAAFFLAFLILVNVRVLASFPGKLKGQEWLVRTLSLDQNWGMFLTPGESGFWVVVGGRTAEGRWIDLLRDGRALDLSRPHFPLGSYPNRRWATLFEAVSRHENVSAHVSPWITNYFCHHWNEQNPQNAIRQSRIHVMWERTVLDGSHPAPTRVVLHDRECRP